MADSGQEIIERFRSGSQPAAPSSSSDGQSSGASIIERFRADSKQEAEAAPPVQPPADTIAPATRSFLSPQPGTWYGSVAPVAQTEEEQRTGSWHWALPSSARDLALGILDLAESPFTGTVTPEGTTALATVATGGRLAPSVARGTGKAIATTAERIAAERAAPLSPEFKGNPLTPELKGAISGTPEPGGPGSTPVGPTTPDPKAAVNPLAGGKGSTTADLFQPTTEPPPKIAATADDAKRIAGAHYKMADERGGTLTSQFTDRFVDAMTKKFADSEAGALTTGETPASALLQRWQALKGKALTLADVQRMDEGLGALIDSEMRPTGMSKFGHELIEIQHSLREQIAAANVGDTTGGKAGFDALSLARKSWSQAMKMADLERMQTRANMTANPDTALRTQIKNLLTSPKRLRGWSDDEVAALRDAAERGTVGSIMHVLGNRIVTPLISAGAGGLVGGVLGGAGQSGPGVIAGALAGEYVAQRSKDVATYLANRRVGNALDVLGRGVPPLNPLNMSGP